MGIISRLSASEMYANAKGDNFTDRISTNVKKSVHVTVNESLLVRMRM